MTYLTQKQVFLFLTNKMSDSVILVFNEIRLSVKEIGDVYMIYHNNSGEIPDKIKNLNHYSFSNDILKELGYTPIVDSIVPGSSHFTVLAFYLKNPFYDFYWFIEDDVRFNGNWSDFFKSFEFEDKPDFISCHIKTFKEEPRWHWWGTLTHPAIYIPNYLKVRSFNPIYCISKDALSFIDYALKDKWQGHHEVLIPSLLELEGFKIMDFGGDGKFVNKNCLNKYYESSSFDLYGRLETGTMRYRPVLQKEEMKMPKLYHPIKL